MRTKISVIVEDNENTCDVIEEWLKSMGCDVQRYEVNQHGAPVNVYPFPTGEYEDGEEG